MCKTLIDNAQKLLDNREFDLDLLGLGLIKGIQMIDLDELRILIQIIQETYKILKANNMANNTTPVFPVTDKLNIRIEALMALQNIQRNFHKSGWGLQLAQHIL